MKDQMSVYECRSMEPNAAWCACGAPGIDGVVVGGASLDGDNEDGDDDDDDEESGDDMVRERKTIAEARRKNE